MGFKILRVRAVEEMDSDETLAKTTLVDQARFSMMTKYLPFAERAYDEDEILLKTELQKEDFSSKFQMVKMLLESDVNKPAWFIAESESENEVILAIRGTDSKESVLTDLLCVAEDVPGKIVKMAAKAHSGMCSAAHWLYEMHIDLLKEYKSKGRKISVTGHSMGAGTAAILTTMLRHNDIEATGYCFATPAVATRNLAESCRDYVFSMVNAEDCVPRLSIRCIGSVGFWIRKIPWKRLRPLEEFYRRLDLGLAMEGLFLAGYDSIVPEKAATYEAWLETQGLSPSDFLYCPGTIIYLQRSKEGKFYPRLLANDDFEMDLKFAGTSILENHLITGFQDNLEKIDVASLPKEAAKVPPPDTDLNWEVLLKFEIIDEEERKQAALEAKEASKEDASCCAVM